MTLELTKEEVNLLINFFQNANVSNINGNAMIALVKIMDKMAALAQAVEASPQGERK